MAYIKYKGTETKYKGESFSKVLNKRDGEWSSGDVATYEMFDSSGNVVSNGTLERSADNKSLSFIVAHTDTENLVGKFKLLVTLSNTNDIRISEIIAEYDIIFEEKKA